MEFELTEEQRMIQTTARDFAAREVAPKAAELDKTGRWPAEIVSKMAELGLLGVAVPEEHGGAGLDNLCYALAMEEKKTDPKAALVSFKKVHDEHPSYVPNYFHYGKTLEETGDEGGARTIYQEGMKASREAGDMKTHDEIAGALDLL